VALVASILFKIDEGATEKNTRGAISVLAVKRINARFKVNARYNKCEWIRVVYDGEGEGLPGVNIVVAETTSGTVSDMDGTFKIKADKSRPVSEFCWL